MKTVKQPRLAHRLPAFQFSAVQFIPPRGLRRRNFTEKLNEKFISHSINDSHSTPFFEGEYGEDGCEGRG